MRYLPIMQARLKYTNYTSNIRHRIKSNMIDLALWISLVLN